MDQEKSFERKLDEARKYADSLMTRRAEDESMTATQGDSHMTTSEYNDNRPEDGQDEREQRRAARESYDLETLDRFIALLERARIGGVIISIDISLARSLSATVRDSHRHLLDKEGY